MTARRFTNRLRSMAEFVGGVAACAAAAEAGRRPSRAALNAAGINADAYYGINR